MSTITQLEWKERKDGAFFKPLHTLVMGMWRLEIYEVYKSDVLVGKVKLDHRTVFDTKGMVVNLLKTELIAWVYDRAREITTIIDGNG